MNNMSNTELYNKIMEGLSIKVKELLNEGELDSIGVSERDPRDARYYTVGDILVDTYHWSMTIPHFYKIVAQPSEKTYEVVQMPEIIVDGNGFQGHCIPDEDKFDERKGERQRLRIRKDNSLSFSKYSWCELWSGKPQYFDHLD